MSKFVVWIDNPTAGTAVFNADALATDTQKINGFQPGTAASARRVNSMLRQNSLLAVGLVEALGIGNDLTLSSSLDSVKNWYLNTNLFKLNAALIANTDSIIPSSNSYISLGNDAARFNEFWVYDIHATDVNVTNLSCTNISATNIGTETNRVAKIYLNDIHASSIDVAQLDADSIDATTVGAQQFNGNLNGTATNAEKATNDGSNRDIVSTYSTNAVASDMWDMLMNLGQRPSADTSGRTGDISTQSGFFGSVEVSLPKYMSSSDITVSQLVPVANQSVSLSSYDSSTGRAQIRIASQVSNDLVKAHIQFKCSYQSYVSWKNY